MVDVKGREAAKVVEIVRDHILVASAMTSPGNGELIACVACDGEKQYLGTTKMHPSRDVAFSRLDTGRILHHVIIIRWTRQRNPAVTIFIPVIHRDHE